MTFRYTAVLTSCALWLSACSAPSHTTATTPGDTPRVAPTYAEIGNATVSGIYDEPVPLADGEWHGEPFMAGGAARPGAGLARDLYLTGDLDGDGAAEAVVIVWEHAGGSGSYSFVAAMGWVGTTVTNLGTARIGDRVQIRGARIDAGRIVLDVIQQGPDDAACCPSQKATRSWTMTPDGLREAAPVIEGTLSLADLGGKRWRLIRMGTEPPLPDSASVSLEVDATRIVGQGPCNRYFADLQAGQFPGDVTIGAVGATRMACPAPLMDLEHAYFQSLSGVTRFWFSMGRLALTWQSGDDRDVMLFDPPD